MRVVADSHAIFWYLQRSQRLSERAAEVLREAGSSERITVSAATVVDLWYVTQTTQAITTEDLTRVRTASIPRRASMPERSTWRSSTPTPRSRARC